MVTPKSPLLILFSALLMLAVVAVPLILFVGGHLSAFATTPSNVVMPTTPSTMPKSPSYSHEKMDFIHKFMAQLDSSFSGASTYPVTITGIQDFALSSSPPISSPSWIIDSRVSHHITGMSSFSIL